MRDVPLSPGCYASKLCELSYSMNCSRRMCSLVNKNCRIRKYKIKKKIAKRVKKGGYSFGWRKSVQRILR